MFIDPLTEEPATAVESPKRVQELEEDLAKGRFTGTRADLRALLRAKLVEKGAGIDDMVSVIAGGLKAEVNGYKGSPDHSTRLKAAELTGRLWQVLGQESRQEEVEAVRTDTLTVTVTESMSEAELLGRVLTVGQARRNGGNGDELPEVTEESAEGVLSLIGGYEGVQGEDGADFVEDISIVTAEGSRVTE